MTANPATGRGSHPVRVASDEPDRAIDEPFEPSEPKVGAERKKPVCIVVEDDITMRHLVMNYLEEHDIDRKSTRLNSSHVSQSRMPSSA